MWKPVPGHLMTRWAKDVSPDNAWPEYPRPQMKRPEWLNLNGLWEYAILPRQELTLPVKMDGEILVPFPLESALSGVKRPLRIEERLWYRCTFFIPESWRGQRVLLHFGAVDWEAKVFVNSKLVGEHVGGYLPFWFDITDVLRQGDNELVVAVWDPTDGYWQQRGKQVREPRTIWYTAVSGIWQTVWLEPLPQTYIAGLKVTPDVDAGTVSVKADVNSPSGSSVASGLHVSAYDGGVLVAEGGADSGAQVTLSIPDPKLWSPDSPHLYDLGIEAGEDRVESYFGMRKFSLGRDDKGRARLCLNNRPLFQYGPLDQGYWPDGLYTPPTNEAMRFDIQLVKGLGCNMLRKHIKVEPARYYYYCDKMGLIVWQDMPSGGAVVDEIRMYMLTRLGFSPRDHNYRRTGRGEAASRDDFRRELREMVDYLHNFACIGMWVPFNEAWGQFDAKAVARWLKEYDPTRPVDHASGWHDQGGGDCRSPHTYFKKLKMGKSEKGRATVLSEFGAYSLKVEGHLWDQAVDFAYKKYPTSGALTEAYLDLLENELMPWVENGLSAAVYTQTTDVENEVNGYVTYDRQVEKMDFAKVRMAHRRLWDR